MVNSSLPVYEFIKNDSDVN
jgi:4-aminobutyrate aminotransferase/(S)-3-amino-2-methylpropionate transaminase